MLMLKSIGPSCRHPTMAAPKSQIEAALPALDSQMRRRLGCGDETIRNFSHPSSLPHTFLSPTGQRLFPVDVARGLPLGLLSCRKLLVVHEGRDGRQVLGVEAGRREVVFL